VWLHRTYQDPRPPGSAGGSANGTVVVVDVLDDALIEPVGLIDLGALAPVLAGPA
jgi:hypothetical protein